MRRTLSSGVLALVAAVVAGVYAIQGGAVDAVAASAASPGRGAPAFRTAPAPIVAASPDLVVDKTPQSDMGGAPPVAAGRFSYLIWYFNQSQTETANGVVVTETLPAGAALAAAVPPPSAANGNTVVFSVGELPPWSGDYITVDVMIAQNAATGSPLANVVSIGSQTADADPSNNVFTSTVLIAGHTVDFSGYPLMGHPPLVVEFSNDSTGAQAEYLWTFGDGSVSTASNPTHTYTTAGSYTVTLTVTRAGASQSVTRANYVRLFSFDDVLPSHPNWLAIERVKAAGLTAGCSADPPMFCPDGLVKREEVAVFIDRALGWPPAPVGVNVFGDLANDYWATPFAETLRAHGVTAGCSQSPPMYCPQDVLSKAEIATMIRAASGWAPVDPPQHLFADVPVGHWAEPHVEAFYAHTPGSDCGSDPVSGKLLFCPFDQVERSYMAELLAGAFGL